jgi:hypothetical protein
MSEEQSSASVAAQRVQAIVEAAEATAREIEENARVDAAAHVAGARDAVEGLVTKAAELQARMDEIAASLAELKGAIDALAAPAAVSAPPVAEPEVGPIVPETPEPEPEVVEEAVAQANEAGATSGRASEGARLVALNMALSGTPREETARYLRENFDLDDQEELLDDVYARAGS